MWTCEVCSTPNDDAFASCMTCGTPRPSEEATGQGAPPAAPSCEQGEAPVCDPAQATLLLTDVRSKERIAVEGGFCVLGREGDLRVELFEPYPSVSRQHIQLERGEGGWSVTDMGSTNGTFCTSGGRRVKLPAWTPYPLYEGALVSLANRLTFRASFADTADDAAGAQVPAGAQAEADAACAPYMTPEPDDDQAVEGWFIACPVCPAVYRVEGASSRMESCPECEDEVDRWSISRVAPVRARRERGTFRDARR